MGIYERIQELCKEHNLSIRKLERELNFGNNTIGKWKNSNPSVEKLQAVADFFDVPIKYFTDQETIVISSKYDNNKLKSDMIRLFSGIDGLDKEISSNTVCIQLADEPEIHMHSKFAYDLVKMMKDMPEEDLEFLANAAQRISPKSKKPKEIIVVENPANHSDKNVVPFPQYPSVTNKDIDEFAARNKKNKFTREEIAEKLYEMDKED